MTCIDNLSSEDLLILINSIAISLSKDRTTDEINVLGHFIAAIGHQMLTFASQQETNKSATENTTTPE